MFLADGVSLRCTIQPLVFFNILDHFIRRSEGHRVIGTLTGIVVDGVLVEVRNCFPVPHTEGDQVGVDMEFLRNMLELHHKVSPREVIVGWYATGNEINEASVMIHDFFFREMSHPPIHLMVDTNLTNFSLNIRAFSSTNITFNDKALASQFLPVPVEIQMLEAEKIGLNMLVKGKANDSATNQVSDLANLEASLKNLHGLLEQSHQYTVDVLEDKIKGDTNVGRFLASTVAALPKIDAAALERMFNNSVHDLLLVVYLSNLTRTQLALTEKLQRM